MRKIIIAIAAAAIAGISFPASAGGFLGELLFGSLDATQSECQAQTHGNFSNTWRCIRARVAQGHTGDMRNGAALKYMATGDMLYASVTSGKMDNATALYHLANALSLSDLE